MAMAAQHSPQTGPIAAPGHGESPSSADVSRFQGDVADRASAGWPTAPYVRLYLSILFCCVVEGPTLEYGVNICI